MKQTVSIKKEIDAKFLSINIVFISYRTLSYLIHIDTGRMIDWRGKTPIDISLSVCNAGSYEIFDADFSSIAKIDKGPVPNNLIPGKDGIYIDLEVDERGVITNWSPVSLNEFFPLKGSN